jgi:hypothetical protein
VQACANNGGRSLAVWTFSRSNPDKKTRQPFKCRNWRCTGNNAECAAFDRKLTYARIREAIDRDKLSADGWVFAVLTVDREGTFSGQKRWRDADEAYREISRMSRKLLEKLRAWQRKQGMRPIGREWVAVVEAHRTGWPHVNFMIWSPELAEYVEREGAALGPEWQRLGFHKDTLPPELMTIARSAHWGTTSTIARARSQDSVINYMAKLAGEAGQALGEIAKLTQLPRNAPQKFRRLRAGKSWLPPRRKNPDITGSVLVRKYDKRDGSPCVMPVHSIKDPALFAHMAEVCYEESRLWERERENAPALRAALDAISLPAIHEATTPEVLAALVAAQREARADAYRELGTPLVYSAMLPVKVQTVELNWPARAGPDPDPELELDFFSD